MITSRQYSYLIDFQIIYDFMIDIYERNWCNGIPAPFLEYALHSTWMDKNYLHRNRIWFDDGKVVAFVFTETYPEQIFFSLRPGYEFLAGKMIEHAENNMFHRNEKQSFILFDGQKTLIEIARDKGYKKVGGHTEFYYDLEKKDPLNYALPEGFHFVDYEKTDPEKCLICLWKGFNHEPDEGPWNKSHIDDAYLLMTAPHYTPQYEINIADDKTGEYVCHAGKWWTPQNHLAYMEPLATVPQYRHKGLASAALSELYRRMKSLGATHMTGGAIPFYEHLGFESKIVWTEWAK